MRPSGCFPLPKSQENRQQLRSKKINEDKGNTQSISARLPASLPSEWPWMLCSVQHKVFCFTSRGIWYSPLHLWRLGLSFRQGSKLCPQPGLSLGAGKLRTTQLPPQPTPAQGNCLTPSCLVWGIFILSQRQIQIFAPLPQSIGVRT